MGHFVIAVTQRCRTAKGPSSEDKRWLVRDFDGNPRVFLSRQAAETFVATMPLPVSIMTGLHDAAKCRVVNLHGAPMWVRQHMWGNTP